MDTGFKLVSRTELKEYMPKSQHGYVMGEIRKHEATLAEMVGGAPRIALLALALVAGKLDSEESFIDTMTVLRIPESNWDGVRQFHQDIKRIRDIAARASMPSMIMLNGEYGWAFSVDEKGDEVSVAFLPIEKYIKIRLNYILAHNGEADSSTAAEIRGPQAEMVDANTELSEDDDIQVVDLSKVLPTFLDVFVRQYLHTMAHVTREAGPIWEASVYLKMVTTHPVAELMLYLPRSGEAVPVPPNVREMMPQAWNCKNVVELQELMEDNLALVMVVAQNTAFLMAEHNVNLLQRMVGNSEHIAPTPIHVLSESVEALNQDIMFIKHVLSGGEYGPKEERESEARRSYMQLSSLIRSNCVVDANSHYDLNVDAAFEQFKQVC